MFVLNIALAVWCQNKLVAAASVTHDQRARLTAPPTKKRRRIPGVQKEPPFPSEITNIPKETQQLHQQATVY